MTFEKKVAELEKKFISLASVEARYHLLIELGRTLPSYSTAMRTPGNLVTGCQSELYLHSRLMDNKLFFKASSDSLISAGLAALLIGICNGETPETILKTTPEFLTNLDFPSILSPNRSNGLFHIHLKMKQEALKYLHHS